MRKSLSDTRRSSRADAVGSLVVCYWTCCIPFLLMPTTQLSGLHSQMSKLEMGVFANFWRFILDRCNQSKTLQSVQLNLNNAVCVLKSLIDLVSYQRDRFDYFEEAGSRVCGSKEYPAQTKRVRRRNVTIEALDYGHAGEAELTPKEVLKASAFIPCVDTLFPE